MLIACSLNMYGRLTVQAEHAMAGSSYIDSSLSVLTDIQYVVFEFFFLEIAFYRLAVP